MLSTKQLYLPLLIAFTSFSCEKKEKDSVCQCTNSNGTIVIDTLFHTTQDEAYQLCEGLESTVGVDQCQSYE